MTLTGPNGGDPTKAVKQGLQNGLMEVTEDAMNVWHTATVDRVVEAAEQRAGTSDRPDDSEGKDYRKQNNLSDMIDEIQPPRWDESEQAWVFTITHVAAVFHEWGADAHEIEAKRAQALAFEWPDAPEEIREQYESSFPTVFFNKVEHPGTPAIGMVRHGRAVARRRLRNAGYSAKGFGEEGVSA